MLEIYHTGATEALKIQTSIDLSLGGFISTSLVPNDLLNNIFSEISMLGRQERTPVIRVIAIKNVSGSTLVNFKVHFDDIPTTDLLSKFTLGWGVFTLDACNDLITEKIPNDRGIPHTVTLTEAIAIGSAVTFGSLDNGLYAPLFVRREILASAIVPFTTDDLIAQETTPLPLEENLSLKFIWD